MLDKDTTEARSLPLPSEAGGIRTFRALGYRSYRYFWLGQLGDSAAMWMEQVIRPLLILQLTGSALMVGLVITVRMVPIFAFGIIAGVIADRYDKRRILMYSQAVTMLMHLTLAVLLISGRVQIWHIFATAFIAGGSMAFKQPARQSMVPRLVPADVLLNGLALNSAAMNIMRVTGASLAGVLLIAFNYGQVYLLNALIFVGVIWTTTQIKLSEPTEIPVELPYVRHRRSRGWALLRDLADGFRYINSNRLVLYLMGMALLIFILGQPYQQVFVPLIALKVLEVGRTGAGWMLALTGVGALIGSITIASRERFPRRGLLMMLMVMVFSLALILLSRSTWIPLSAVALILAGSMQTSYMALNNSLLLERTPQEFHGRVMSLMSLDRGLMSVGAILAGSLAEALGPQLGLTIIAGTCLGLTILAFLFVPVLRRIQ
ncbi:MAG: MFS transporter [Chloroflexi bacterium]|nr:MFS transporter [Chloroflexota bacterium]